MAQDRPKLTVDIIRKLPKVDLHRHLDGSVRVETVVELAEEQGVCLPTNDLEELRALIEVDNDCESLVEYLRGFTIVNSVAQKPYALTRMFFEACEDAVADGLRYVEIRFAPILHVNELMSLTQVMEAVCEGKAMAEYHLPITARIILCGMRHMPPETTMSVAELAWRYRNRGVVAFDLAGPESGFASSKHKAAFELVRKQMLKMTVHSGEAAGAESILDAIRYCGAHRIGHGTTLGDSPELLAYVVNRGIPLEVCPTSNLQTKAVSALADHPLKSYLEANVCVTINTDNPRISGVTLSDELMVCHTELGMDLAQIVRIIDNGFSATFLERGTKKRMRAEALYQTVSILRSEGFDVSPIVNDPHYYSAAVNFHKSLQDPYWGTASQPAISRDLVAALPKIDAHRRVAGSASLDVVWKHFADAVTDDSCPVTAAAVLGLDPPQDAPATWLPDRAVFDALVESSDTHTPGSTSVAKRVFNLALQTRDAIADSVADIFASAAADNYLYIELVLEPSFHTGRGLTMAHIVDATLDAIASASESTGVLAGLVLAVSVSPATLCDPLVFREIAELAVARKGPVSGVGALAPSTSPLKTTATTRPPLTFSRTLPCRSSSPPVRSRPRPSSLRSLTAAPTASPAASRFTRSRSCSTTSPTSASRSSSASPTSSSSTPQTPTCSPRRRSSSSSTTRSPSRSAPSAPPCTPPSSWTRSLTLSSAQTSTSRTCSSSLPAASMPSLPRTT
ncbi:adenosine deaminase [Thecamonas trahens ATCC 50062]|uniref:adenosine deaminase n=1 Tax=Thecamonas trahens ATCC 50062 TaxID=461836 RepID=A0A0L0DB76_THETB|nr:adenosine deaminase [Thecamonas trahens ATCC 50062]KNC48558.1 adenosine deaminase [Thecamonas trahens ATCC 50062]|eukprot:XP_013762615.1 adenosine deaminase [Thecamonas trahens ATCC 50062]